MFDDEGEGGIVRRPFVRWLRCLSAWIGGALLVLLAGCTDRAPSLATNQSLGMGECSSSSEVSEERLVAEEHAVYTAVLRQKFSSWHEGKVEIVDSALPPNDPLFGPSSSWDWLTDEFPSVSPETVEAFLDASKQSHVLTTTFDVRFEYAFISREDIPGFFHTCELAEGVVEFSRVGFNHEMDQALVYVAIQGCGLWGGGFFMLLEKSNDRWIEQGEVQSWGS